MNRGTNSSSYISDHGMFSLLANILLWRHVYVGGFGETDRVCTT